VLLFAGVAIHHVEARELTLDDRVRARRAIEEVYWKHRIWPADNPQPKPPLGAVLSDPVLRARVIDDLKKSNALSTCGIGPSRRRRSKPSWIGWPHTRRTPGS
jgi:hypothetical protein